MKELMLKAKSWELAIMLFGLMPIEIREGFFRKDEKGEVIYEFSPLKNIAAALLEEIKKT